ncbi:MAG: hypothetical protein ACREE5_05815 [Acetobacteraceae bacterium]
MSNFIVPPLSVLALSILALSVLALSVLVASRSGHGSTPTPTCHPPIRRPAEARASVPTLTLVIHDLCQCSAHQLFVCSGLLIPLRFLPHSEARDGATTDGGRTPDAKQPALCRSSPQSGGKYRTDAAPDREGLSQLPRFFGWTEQEYARKHDGNQDKIREQWGTRMMGEYCLERWLAPPIKVDARVTD